MKIWCSLSKGIFPRANMTLVIPHVRLYLVGSICNTLPPALFNSEGKGRECLYAVSLDYFSFFFEIIQLNKYELKRTLKETSGPSLVARRVTLAVAFSFLPQNFGVTYKWYSVILWMQVECWGTLKPYLLKSNLSDFFALTGSGDAKTCSHPSHLEKLSLPNFWPDFNRVHRLR